MSQQGHYVPQTRVCNVRGIPTTHSAPVPARFVSSARHPCGEGGEGLAWLAGQLSPSSRQRRAERETGRRDRIWQETWRAAMKTCSPSALPASINVQLQQHSHRCAEPLVALLQM